MRCLLLAPVLLLASLDDSATETIGKAFLEQVIEQRDFAAAEQLTKANLYFIDPTAVSLGMPLAEGIRGRKQVLECIQSFGLERAELQPRYEFSAGPYHCFVGSIKTWARGATEPATLPFMTTLKVEDGQVIERLDYGDYDVFLPETLRIDGIEADQAHPRVLAAEEYMRAYQARDFEAMQALRSDDVVFHDRTALRLGAGAAIRGNENLNRLQKRTLGAAESFELELDYRFFHGDFAVFAGTAQTRLAGSALGLEQKFLEFSHSLAVVLRFEEDQVVRHEEFADHQRYVLALDAAKRAAERAED